MPSSKTLVDQIEALPRSEFRAVVNAERRVTLAIGVLMLHWGQFESRMGWLIDEMRERHVHLGFGGLPAEHPSDHAGQFALLRKFICACDSEANRLREFDRLRGRLWAAKAIRDDIAHGALALGNSTGTDDGLFLLCMQRRKGKISGTGFVPPRHEMVRHFIVGIFSAADQVWDDQHALEHLVNAAGRGTPPMASEQKC
jgi:hypothetical protein